MPGHRVLRSIFVPTVIGLLCSACVNDRVFWLDEPLKLTVVPVYSTQANWNDYLKVTDAQADAYHQPEIACAGTEIGFAACLHGGEVRKVVVAGRADCAGLKIEDALGAFDWDCQVEAGTVVFYSRGLKD
jgi:hypothetical protein